MMMRNTPDASGNARNGCQNKILNEASRTDAIYRVSPKQQILNRSTSIDAIYHVPPNDKILNETLIDAMNRVSTTKPTPSTAL